MSTTASDRIPVIVGVGEIADHPTELTAGLEPLALLEAAVRRAAEDAGAPLLGEIDSLDVVNFLSWRYRDPEQQLAAKLGIKPPHCFYGPVGGESPIRYLHKAAQRIARGQTKVALVCGAEAQSTATKAERAKITLPWTPFAHDVPEPKRSATFQKPMAVTLGVFGPLPSIRCMRPRHRRIGARRRARHWRNPASCGRAIRKSPPAIRSHG
jgi:acetyl-CoA C-acetyltransferase